MLCDMMMEAKHLLEEYPRFKETQKAIAVARKFVLAPDITAAADGLMNNIPQLMRILPFCRLPFPFCWFELAQADRPHFMASGIDFPEHQAKPKRVGFLCISHADNILWHWVTMLCWSIQSIHNPRSSELQGNASLLTVEFNTKETFNPYPKVQNLGEIGRYIKPHPSTFCPPEFHNFKTIRDLNASDWGGEVRYLIALLGLLNSRNVAEHHEVDNSTYNKKRVKQGKSPLSSHTLLKIRAIHRHSFTRPGRPPSSSEEIRKHFVIGHWKTRKTGLFWWNPFMRGKRGMVTHDYEITT